MSAQIGTHYFDSCFIYFWKVLLCRGLLPFAITNKNIGYLSVTELKNSVFPNLVLLSCTPVATNSFSCPSLRWSYTVKYMFLPSGIQLGEETNVGRQRLNRALESLFTFTLLVFRTKQDAWHKQIQLKTYPRLAIFSLWELNQMSPLVCFEGWNKFLVPIWSPWELNLTQRWRGCQLGLLSINFVLRNVIFQPIVFPFIWAKFKWNKFYERSLQALLSSAPRGFATCSHVIAKLASLPPIGELARRLVMFFLVCIWVVLFSHTQSPELVNCHFLDIFTHNRADS